MCVFFFQAEDGIRDHCVTGVQTCALPICHRPGQMGPMSLLTYEDARPWARSIKAKVAARMMPPWHLDRTVGIQKFKNDISLSDDQVNTIVRWVDAGAPQGDAKDLPAPIKW